VNRRIVVASHETTGLDLPYPYYEMVRTDSYDLSANKHQVISLKDLPGPTLPWSEYAQLFTSFPLSTGIETYGLMHYRCAINFESEETLDVFSNRVDFFKRQVSYMNMYYDQIVVGSRLNFPVSAWDQYCHFHRPHEPLLEFACNEFFDATGYDAQTHLRSETFLYPRNMFVAPVNFAQRWHDVSLKVAKYLDTLDSPSKTATGGIEGYQVDRWGGYILERLFSVFVHNETKLEVVEKPLIYFTENQ